MLLLDEPSVGLDDRARAVVLDHLDRLPQAMILISHDAAVREQLATRTVHLRDGRLFDNDAQA